MRRNVLAAGITARTRSTRPFVWLALLAMTSLSIGTAAASPAGVLPQEQTEGTAPANPEPGPLIPEAEPPIPDPPTFLTDIAGTIGDVFGDVFFWGQSATVTGDILNNAFLGGQVVTLDGGSVGSDVFAFGQSVLIDGVVNQNVYAFGSTVRIARDAVIHGNVMVFAGSLRVEGRIRGKLLGSSGMAVLDGEIGSVKLEAGDMTITERAHVLGDLEYNCKEAANIAEGAVIDGELLWNPGTDDDAEEADEPARSAPGFSFWSFGWNAWRYLSSLVVGFAFLLLGGKGARMPALCLREQPAPGLGFGFVVAVVFPVACLIAIALIISLPLGLIGLVLFALLVFVARLITAQYIGDWLLRRISGNESPSEYLSLALGLLLLLVVVAIPYVGFLVRAAAVILGIGGVYLALRHAGFPAPSQEPPPLPGATG